MHCASGHVTQEPPLSIANGGHPQLPPEKVKPEEH